MGAPWVIYQIKTRFGKTITDIYQFRTVRERNLFQHHYITHHSSPLITILLISSTPPSSSQSVSLARSLMNTFLAESVRDIVVKGTISDKKVILRFSFKVKSFFLIGNCKKKKTALILELWKFQFPIRKLVYGRGFSCIFCHRM